MSVVMSSAEVLATNLLMACCPNLSPSLEQKVLVIRPGSLMTVQLQVSLDLAVQEALHDIAGDFGAHDKPPDA